MAGSGKCRERDMVRRILSRLTAFWAVVLAPLWGDVALADKRIALVVGNSAYQNVVRLPNPLNDATAVGNMFRNAGFDVVDSRFDLGNIEFKRAIREFTYQARDTDIAVIYYAGHGIEVGGTNYLIPVDAKLATDLDAEDEGVPLDRVVRAMEPARRLRLIILDACRDNPFNQKMRRTMAMRAVNNGLAKIELTLGDTMIAYAAKAGSTAEDGNGVNSPFTAALLKYLPEPGLDVRLAFGRVRDDVWSRTGHRQEPFVYTSLGGSEVSLVPAAPKKTEPTPPPAAADNEVRRAFELTVQVGTKEAWEAFLEDYKTGLYADLARVQLAKLATAPPPQDSARQAAEADRAWDMVKETNDRVAIRKFIELFPASVHVPNARHRLDLLEQATQEREAAAHDGAKQREDDAERAKAAEIEKQRQEHDYAERQQRLREELKRADIDLRKDADDLAQREHAEQERLAARREQASSVSPAALMGNVGTPSEGVSGHDEARRNQAEAVSAQTDAQAQADRERLAAEVKKLQAEKARLADERARLERIMAERLAARNDDVGKPLAGRETADLPALTSSPPRIAGPPARPKSATAACRDLLFRAQIDEMSDADRNTLQHCR